MLYLIIPPIIVVSSLALLVYFFSKKFQEIDVDALDLDNQESSQDGTHDYREKTKRSFDVIISFFGGLLQVGKDILLAIFGALSRLAIFLWNKIISLKPEKKNETEQSSITMKRSVEDESYETMQEEADVQLVEQEEVLSTSQRAFPYKKKRSFQPFTKKQPASKTEDSAVFVRQRKSQVERIDLLQEEVSEKKAVRPMVSQRQVQPERKEIKKEEVKRNEVESAPVKNQLEDILIERIAANPRDIEAYERLGEYYMEQNNLQDAKECYRQVLRLSPVHRLAKIKIRKLERLLEQR